MIRAFCSSLARFAAAIVLLALVVCAAEVGVRAWRLRQFVNHGTDADAAGLTLPSSRTWVNVQPLLNVRLPDDTGRPVRIQTNELGLRAPTITLPKPRGTYRILCVGGSSVFGAGVDQAETMPAWLQQFLKSSAMQVEVINAGCPDAGPLVSLLRYRQELSQLQADLVLLCLSPEELRQDELVRGVVRLDESRSPAFAPHPAADRRSMNAMDSMCQEFVTLEWILNLAGDAAGMPKHTSVSSQGSAPDPRRWAAVVPLHQLISTNMGNLAISVAPGAWSLTETDESTSEASRLREFLSQVNLASIVPVQDSLSMFQQVGDPRSLFSSTSGQLSAPGNQLYARQVAEFLYAAVPGLRGEGGATAVRDNTPLPLPANPPAIVPAPIPYSNPADRLSPLTENPATHPLWAR